MNEEQLERYSRQLLIPNFDVQGQLALLDAKVLIVGLGGLGNIASAYLAGAGVGHLNLLDDDRIELSNLQRQVLYRQQQIGEAKAVAAQKELRNINPDVDVHILTERLDDAALQAQIQKVDLVLDCTDNFQTRQQINRICVQQNTNLISAAAIRWEGQLVSFLYEKQRAPCYQCLYPQLNDAQLSCSRSGIVSPVVGAIGVMQALEAVKLLSGCGKVEHGKLRLFDGYQGEWRQVRLSQDPDCPVCNTDA